VVFIAVPFTGVRCSVRGRDVHIGREDPFEISVRASKRGGQGHPAHPGRLLGLHDQTVANESAR
jgi:hypothetical protein